jgi:hypothetical protein
MVLKGVGGWVIIFRSYSIVVDVKRQRQERKCALSERRIRGVFSNPLAPVGDQFGRTRRSEASSSRYQLGPSVLVRHVNDAAAILNKRGFPTVCAANETQS